MNQRGQFFDGWQAPVGLPAEIFAVELGDEDILGILPGIKVAFVVNTAVIGLDLPDQAGAVLTVIATVSIPTAPALSVAVKVI